MDDTAPNPPITERTRRHWLFATLILCGYGFFKEFKPSEAFLTPYLVSDVKNFTNAQLSSEVWPYSTYSYLVASLLVCLLTDMLRYKPVIVLESGCYLATRILLIWGVTIASMQWMQVAYGVAEATEIAYYSYIYAAVSSVHFKKVTSYVRAIRLFGQSMAGFLGQILISTGALGYLELNYISLASVSVACVFSLLLPNVFNCSQSCGRKQQSDSDQTTTLLNQPSKNLESSCLQWMKKAVLNGARDFAKFYCTPSLLKWSIWWALSTCGVLQVGNYVQNLWTEVAEESNGQDFDGSYWNGVVEALATLCSAGAAFSLSFVKMRWAYWGELTIGLLSLVDSGLLLLASWTNQLWLVYLCHIIYRTTYAFLITIASTQVALSVEHESYGLIFGFNYFLALVLQTILTVTVADKHGLHLDIRTQVYSGYYYVLTIVFIGAGIYKLTTTGWLTSCRNCCPSHQAEDEQESDSSRQPEPLRPTIQDVDDTTNNDTTNQII